MEIDIFHIFLSPNNKTEKVTLCTVNNKVFHCFRDMGGKMWRLLHEGLVSSAYFMYEINQLIKSNSIFYTLIKKIKNKIFRAGKTSTAWFIFLKWCVRVHWILIYSKLIWAKTYLSSKSFTHVKFNQYKNMVPKLSVWIIRHYLYGLLNLSRQYPFIHLFFISWFFHYSMKYTNYFVLQCHTSLWTNFMRIG